MRFLWVDAFCNAIVKWRLGTGKFTVYSTIMDQIYGNAFIKIAAAAAKNVHQGIFRTRKIPKIVQLPHKSQDPYDYIKWDDICG
jgi:regulator of sigma D